MHWSGCNRYQAVVIAIKATLGLTMIYFGWSGKLFSFKECIIIHVGVVTALWLLLSVALEISGTEGNYNIFRILNSNCENNYLLSWCNSVNLVSRNLSITFSVRLFCFTGLYCWLDIFVRHPICHGSNFDGSLESLQFWNIYQSWLSCGKYLQFLTSTGNFSRRN